jgi:methylmalonyl-CoA/ethylmalonyl-CoA epimerase
MTINKIDHIAIVVPDIQEALTFWRDALGLQLSHVEEVPTQEVSVAFLPIGDSEIELVEPTTDTSSLARYVAKRGPGMHHICFEVEDIEATLARLKGQGVELINEEPTIGAGGKRAAFIHPRSTGGVLVELYE